MTNKVVIKEKPSLKDPILEKPIAVQIDGKQSELSLDAALQLAADLKHAVNLIRIRRQ